MKKNIIFTGSLIFIMIFLVFITLLINRSTIAVKIYELSLKISRLDSKEKGVDYIDILFKYETNRKLYTGAITEAEADLEELKMVTALSHNDKEHVRIKKEALIALPVINIIRAGLGKTPVEYGNEADNEAYNLAYYYETNGFYQRAIEIYDSLAPYLAEDDRVLLHKGYCYALTGNDALADDALTKIINANRDGDIVITAAALLMHIRDFRTESEKVIAGSDESLGKSIKLLKLTSFEKAFQILSRIEKTDKNTDLNVAYYKAKYYEETGDKEKAIDLYQDIIESSPDSEAAAKANRRIFFISITHDSKDELQKLSSLNNEIIKDPVYTKMRSMNSALSPDKPASARIEVADKDFNEKIKAYTKKAEISAVNVKKVDRKAGRNGSYSLSYYTKSGDISKIENYDRKGRIAGYYVYVYDSQGNRIRIDAYDKDGNKLEYY